MVDFKKHIKKNEKNESENLVEVFESLDRYATHTDLRPSQREALEKLSDIKDERDIVLKVSTGAGKTTTGLIYLYHYLQKSVYPVVYLCPTVQLVKQVEEEAKKLGIKTSHYAKGQKRPDISTTNGNSILVCTYDKLFNGKSTFNRTEVELRPKAIVLDDAHSGIEEIREAFNITITNKEIYNEIKDILSNYLSGYYSSKWNSLEKGLPDEILEVPYWAWRGIYHDVDKILQKNSESIEIKFAYPHLQSLLRYCRCVISGNQIEIAPPLPSFEKCPAYTEAPNKLFMSATLADDSFLIREANCTIKDEQSIIQPPSDRGVGERMVIAPEIVSPHMNREWLMNYGRKLSSSHNVVILSPSEKKAKDWEEYGATVFMGEQIEEAVEKLKSSKYNFFIFVQRYDGIDLPDESCRVLIIDGLPIGESLIDKNDANKISTAGKHRNQIIYKVEQGMGRAVRSPVDYAVVLLSGADLGYYISKHEIQDNMSSGTKAQLIIATRLVEILKEDKPNPKESELESLLKDTVNQCLSRDKDWKEYYKSSMEELTKHEKIENINTYLDVATAERKAWNEQICSNPQKSSEILTKISNEIKGIVSEKELGWLLQSIASYTHEYAPDKATKIQDAAVKKNKSCFKPENFNFSPNDIKSTGSSQNILNYINSLKNVEATVILINKLKNEASKIGKAKKDEKLFNDVAQLLGANGSRPEDETGLGPDNLWIWDDYHFVTELKTGNQNSLHKKDAGQLHTSLKWHSDTFGLKKKTIPLTFSKVTILDNDAHYPEGALILTNIEFSKVLNNLELFYKEIINELPLFTNTNKIAELQEKYKLKPELFIKENCIKA